MTIKEKLNLMTQTRMANDAHIRAMIKTNRDLMTMYETEDKPSQMAALAEMARATKPGNRASRPAPSAGTSPALKSTSETGVTRCCR